MSNRKRPLNKGFRPRPTFHLPQAPVAVLAEGSTLNPHLDAEDEQEKAIAANPLLAGYVARFGSVAPAQRRLTFRAYGSGWSDAANMFQAAYAAKDAIAQADDFSATYGADPERLREAMEYELLDGTKVTLEQDITKPTRASSSEQISEAE